MTPQSSLTQVGPETRVFRYVRCVSNLFTNSVKCREVRGSTITDLLLRSRNRWVTVSMTSEDRKRGVSHTVTYNVGHRLPPTRGTPGTPLTRAWTPPPHVKSVALTFLGLGVLPPSMTDPASRFMVSTVCLLTGGLPLMVSPGGDGLVDDSNDTA